MTCFSRDEEVNLYDEMWEGNFPFSPIRSNDSAALEEARTARFKGGLIENS